jgi:hypothetical protein
MSNSKTLQWIKCYKVSSVWLLLSAIGVFAHFLARWRMERSGRQFDFMDPVTIRHIPLIDTVHAHMVYPVGYLSLLLLTFCWLEWRKARDWVRWTVFVVFAVPALDYVWACLALGTRFAIYNPP